MISNEQLAALDALAKEAISGPWSFRQDRPDFPVYGYVIMPDGIHTVCKLPYEGITHDAKVTKTGKYIAAANPSVIRALIAELREYRHLCAQVRAVYESDSGFGEGMVISCHRESQRKDTQAVAAMLIWQQPADESADLRIGIRADMT